MKVDFWTRWKFVLVLSKPCGWIIPRENRRESEGNVNQPYWNPNLCIRFMSMELNPICCASSIRWEEKVGKEATGTFTETVSKIFSGTWKSFSSFARRFSRCDKNQNYWKISTVITCGTAQFFHSSSKHFTSPRHLFPRKISLLRFFVANLLLFLHFKQTRGKISFFSATNRNRKINSKVAHARQTNFNFIK